MVQAPEQSIRHLDRKQGRQMVDELTRQYLDMGLEEFLRAWDAGEFEDTDTPEVMRIAMLLPFVRNGR